MFPDLLLNTHNLVPEVRFAPGIVTSYIQIESVEIGEARKRNVSADVESKSVNHLWNTVKNNVNQVWDAAETRIETPPFLVLQQFQFFWK